jgi:hypothetical protein
MKYNNLKSFEELSDNDYRNDDPISKLKMMELIYNTIIGNDENTISHSEIEDEELDMEASEISFKYKGVPFRLTIKREEEGLQEECALPRKSSVMKFKKMAKKAGKNKSLKVAGGSDSLIGKIATKE